MLAHFPLLLREFYRWSGTLPRREHLFGRRSLDETARFLEILRRGLIFVSNQNEDLSIE